MSTFTVTDASDVEAVRGAFRKMRIALDARAFGVNQIELPAGASGPEHDEEATDHEEVYVVLAGSGVLRIGEDEVQLLPGRWVRVDASASRQMSAGDDGLTFIAIGAPTREEHSGRPTL